MSKESILKEIQAARVSVISRVVDENKRKKVVKYLQPYYKRGNRWFKLKVK